jgi:hypothetical protein
MVFIDRLNHLLESYNASPVEGIRYEQYTLLEFNGVVIVKENNIDLAVIPDFSGAKIWYIRGRPNSCRLQSVFVWLVLGYY